VRLIADGAGEEEFTRPGHLVTLRYTVGGTRRRRGHTEAAVGELNDSFTRLPSIVCIPFLPFEASPTAIMSPFWRCGRSAFVDSSFSLYITPAPLSSAYNPLRLAFPSVDTFTSLAYTLSPMLLRISNWGV
jgi:hypothetical protein